MKEARRREMRLDTWNSFHAFLLGIAYDCEESYWPLLRDSFRCKDKGRAKDKNKSEETRRKDDHETGAAFPRLRSIFSGIAYVDGKEQANRRKARDKFNEVEARPHSLAEWLDAFADLAAASGPTVPSCAVRSRLRHVIRNDRIVERLMAVLRFRSSGEFDPDPAKLLAHRITRLELRNQEIWSRRQASSK
jgi:hypothetical protein